MRGKGEGERKSINNHMGGWGSSVNGGCEVLIKVVKASRLACKKGKRSYGWQGRGIYMSSIGGCINGATTYI